MHCKAQALDELALGHQLPNAREEAWPFYRTSSGVRLWGSSKDLNDLKDSLVEDLVLTCIRTSLILSEDRAPF